MLYLWQTYWAMFTYFSHERCTCSVSTGAQLWQQDDSL